MLRTVRADITGRGAALRGRKGAWSMGGYKRVVVRARPAQCGRALGAGEALGGVRCGRRRQRGAEWGRWGLVRAVAATVGPPCPGRRPGERRKGAGGTLPRLASVMVSAVARPGRGSGERPPLEKEAGSQEPLAGGRAGCKVRRGILGRGWAHGPSYRRGRSSGGLQVPWRGRPG